MTPEQMLAALSAKYDSLRSACFSSCPHCHGAQNFDGVDWMVFMEEVQDKVSVSLSMPTDVIALATVGDASAFDRNPRIALLTAVYEATKGEL